MSADEHHHREEDNTPREAWVPEGRADTIAQDTENLARARLLSARCAGPLEDELPTPDAGLARQFRRARPSVHGYDVCSPLGRGTYGEVWLARERGTGIRVAIKFFAHGTGGTWQSLQEEVRRLAELDGVHGIVQLKDVSAGARPPYYVMAYAEQGSLARRLANGPLPLPEALALFRQVAEALAYVHAKGIRHCDLKPGNILLDARGRPLIADFGQAHLSDDATPALGTFFYMAPEHADLSRRVPDTRWDVYGLGALFYAMLTGKPPRLDEDLRKQLEGTADLGHRLKRYRDCIRHAPRPTGHRRVAGMDPALAEIIDGCLEIDPARRPRDAGAVLEALDRRARRRRQRPLLLFGLVAPVLLLLFMALAGFGVADAALDASRRDLTRQFLDNEEVSARLGANVVQEHLEARLKLLKAFDGAFLYQAMRCGNQADLERALSDMLRISAETNTRFAEATVSDRDGVIRAVVRDEDGRPVAVEPYRKHPHYSWRDWFNGVGDRPFDPGVHYPPVARPHVSDPYVSTIDHRLLVSLSLPIRDPDDPGAEPVGVLEAAIRLQDVNRWLLNVRLEGGCAVILDNRRYCLLHPEQEKIEPRAGGRPPHFDFAAVEAALAVAPSGRLADYRDPVDGAHYLAGYARMQKREDAGWVEDVDWVVLVQHRRSAVLQPIDRLRDRLVGLGGRLALAAGLLTSGLWGWLFWTLRRWEHAPHG